MGPNTDVEGDCDSDAGLWKVSESEVQVAVCDLSCC